MSNELTPEQKKTELKKRLQVISSHFKGCSILVKGSFSKFIPKSPIQGIAKPNILKLHCDEYSTKEGDDYTEIKTWQDFSQMKKGDEVIIQCTVSARAVSSYEAKVTFTHYEV
jgi:hypothetical protein